MTAPGAALTVPGAPITCRFLEMSDLRDFALSSNAWPFVEARSVLKHVRETVPEKGYVLFETGYGPSGLPHPITGPTTPTRTPGMLASATPMAR